MGNRRNRARPSKRHQQDSSGIPAVVPQYHRNTTALGYRAPEPVSPSQPPISPLHDEFAFGPPRRIVSSATFRRLDNRQRRYILWARVQGISLRVVGEELGAHPTSVERLIKMARENPLVFVECGFMGRRGGGREVEFLCGMCGKRYRDRDAAATHGYGHVFPEELLELPPEQRGRYLAESRSGVVYQ